MSEDLIYFRDGELVAQSGEARVYKMSGYLFLEIGKGHTLWALETELKDYMDQLSDLPQGDCLEIGLGLGVASRYILTFPKVKSLTTVEINKDVIEAHYAIEESDRGHTLDYRAEDHTILNANGIEYSYITKKKFDFIFIDCYDRIDEDTLPLIADVVLACRHTLKPNGRMLGWVDEGTSAEHFDVFQHIFEVS